MPMDATAVAAVLDRLVPGSGAQALAAIDQPTLVVSADRLAEACRALRDDPALGYTALLDIVGVDRQGAEPRFELSYSLLAADAPARLRVKVRLAGPEPHVGTVTGIWPSAGFLEREVWDLLGVVFDGHPDLRRLLTPDEWEGHPLRKDYPVQIGAPVRTYEPIQVTEEQFAERILKSRRVRGSGTR
ncbi:MAG TPA: NADH-quinone oxidoreductase subunit C [Vicinamibacterales bacterium]|nr:NADH-quinone oxidoreductase subunit C [Vicinamibacterales bacterium]HPW21635.1 NADH-quinone oxidoreductase subunit C [Vicinamibacterales bacterium]